MAELIEKLGIDWKLLSAQVLNFLVILLVLRFTAYKPLLSILRTRREKIEKGLLDAEAATKHLGEVQAIGKQKIAEAEREGLAAITKAESAAREKESALLLAAHGKESEILAAANRQAAVKKAEVEEAFYNEAASFVRSAMIKTANLSPNAVDVSLIEEGIKALKKQNHEA